MDQRYYHNTALVWGCTTFNFDVKLLVDPGLPEEGLNRGAW